MLCLSTLTSLLSPCQGDESGPGYPEAPDAGKWSSGHVESGFSGIYCCDLQTFLCYVMPTWAMMPSYIMASGPAVRMTSGNLPVAYCDHLPDIVTLRWWLVSMRFLLRITHLGTEGFGIICGGFLTCPILLDFLKMAFWSSLSWSGCGLSAPNSLHQCPFRTCLKYWERFLFSWLNFDQATELCLWPQYHSHGRAVSLDTFCACHPPWWHWCVLWYWQDWRCTAFSPRWNPPHNSDLEDRPFIRESKGRQQSEEEAEREEKGKKMTNRVVGKTMTLTVDGWLREGQKGEQSWGLPSPAAHAPASGQWAPPQSWFRPAPRLGLGVLPLSLTWIATGASGPVSWEWAYSKASQSLSFLFSPELWPHFPPVCSHSQSLSARLPHCSSDLPDRLPPPGPRSGCSLCLERRPPRVLLLLIFHLPSHLLTQALLVVLPKMASLPELPSPFPF